MSDSVDFRIALRVLREAGYTYGSTTREAITWATKDEEWQKLRKSMKGKPTGYKILDLVHWFADGLMEGREVCLW
jgi:hypothetical protein